MSGDMVPLSTIENPNRFMQVALHASRELAKSQLQNPARAEAEILPLPLEDSPRKRKALLKNSDWGRASLLNSYKAKQSGLLAIRILSDAFFFKCGYKIPWTTPEENEAWDRLKKERGGGTRVQCIKNSTKKLKEEAKITWPELQEFLQLPVVAKPDSVFARSSQNQAAHSLPVCIMALHLQRLFRAQPDAKAEKVLEKIFVWLCSVGWEEAIVKEDGRIIRVEGVGQAVGGLGRVPFADGEFSGAPVGELEEGWAEEVGSFF